MSDSTLSSLEQIRIKIRRLTKSPSVSQISDADIDNYVNTFILYDMPAHIKLDSLKKVLTFYTEANTESYSTSNTITNPMYNFKNKYTNVTGKISVAGNPINFIQDREEFYNIYPNTNYKIEIGTGNGVTTNFTGTLSDIPFLPNNVTATSTDTGGARLLATDDGLGSWTGDVTAPGTIAYLAGAYDITFDLPPANGETVWIQTIPYEATVPLCVLYINETFTFRPIPDIAYRVDVEVLQRPTELLLSTDIPELSEWWQYISYGAAIKILQDRSDMESVSMLLNEFNKQEILIGRRQIVQNSLKRSPTIYQEY